MKRATKTIRIIAAAIIGAAGLLALAGSIVRRHKRRHASVIA